MSSRNKPARFTVDFVSKQIIGTKTSLNKAKKYGSDEYNELCELMEAHPRFKVVTKKVKQNNSRHTYKALNFTFIEKYISIQPNGNELVREYNEIKQLAAVLNMSIYPYTKSWFLKKFPSFDMDKAREEINELVAAPAQATM